MNHSEKRKWLINYLLEENSHLSKIVDASSDDPKEQNDLLRCLLNIREARPIHKDFIDIQNQFLLEERAENQIFSLNDAQQYTKNLYLWQGDITRLEVDAIVNAANAQLLGCFVPLHRCIDNAIHSAAGIQLRLACKEIMDAQGHLEETGYAKITDSYNLSAKKVIHTVGPIIKDTVTKEHVSLLADCYRRVLLLCEEYQLKSVAFCCISTGEFRFPNELAAEIAIKTTQEYVTRVHSPIKIIFNVFKDIDKELYHEKLQQLSESLSKDN